MQLAQRSHETHFSLSPRQVKYAICKINQYWCSTHRKIGCSHTLETSFLHKHSSTSIKETLQHRLLRVVNHYASIVFQMKNNTSLKFHNGNKNIREERAELLHKV